MFGRSTKEKAQSQLDLAARLAKDKKFRRELMSAIRHGEIARRRARRRIGFVAAAQRLGADPKLRREVRKMIGNLEKARMRVEKKRSHTLRNTLLLVGAAGVVVAVPQ